MNPIAWFESIMARIEDHINITNSIHDFISEIKTERTKLMADFSELKAAVAELKAAVEGFVVPAPVDDSADVDAVTADVKAVTDELKAKVDPKPVV